MKRFILATEFDTENSAFYAAKKASESVHVRFNGENRGIEVVNNRPEALNALKVKVLIYAFDGPLNSEKTYPVAQVPGSSTVKAAQIVVSARISALYFIKLDLTDANGTSLSTNFYWQHVAQDQFDGLMDLPTVVLDARRQYVGDRDIAHQPSRSKRQRKTCRETCHSSN